MLVFKTLLLRIVTTYNILQETYIRSSVPEGRETKRMFCYPYKWLTSNL